MLKKPLKLKGVFLSHFAMNAIYLASEGEGVHVGTPQVFVRFQGCNIGCVNCDSIDTWDFSAGERLTLDDVLKRIIEEGGEEIRRVSITGGDPLHPKLLPSVLELTRTLKKKGYYVNLEAAGTRIVDELFDLLDYVSFDYKTPSTGVRTNPMLISRMAMQYPRKFQVKAVVENRADFDDTVIAKNLVMESLKGESFEHFPWVLTPAFNLGESMPMQRVLDVISWNEEARTGFRVITQQHKILHGSEKKRV